MNVMYRHFDTREPVSTDIDAIARSLEKDASQITSNDVRK
jgi:hypothetical protein